MRSFPFVSRDHFAHCIGFSRFCYLFFRCLVLRCGRLCSDYCVFAVYHCKRRFYLARFPVRYALFTFSLSRDYAMTGALVSGLSQT